MNQYVKSISKRSETEEKDKNLPIGYLGKVMVSHGEDFDEGSEFGQSLICELSCFNDWTRTDQSQTMDEPKRSSHGFKTPMLSTQPQAGLSHQTDPLRR